MKEMTLKEIEKALGYEIKIIADKPGRKLADIAVGETFKVGELEFVVLEHSKDTTAVILKSCWKRAEFDCESNNYAESDIRSDLNTTFYNTLSSLVGKDNIIKHTVDLTSDDGRKGYEKVEDFVSMLTCDLFRRYVYILDKYKPGMWWWLATAYSTKSNGYTTSVRCVDDDVTLIYYFCNDGFGVRPFGNQTSQIFALLYLNRLDHYITDDLHIQFYGRYMDDFYLIHQSKEYLKDCLIQIEKIISNLKLSLNGKTQIMPFNQGIKFLGFHTYINNGNIVCKIRNENKRNACRKYKKMAKLVKEGKLEKKKFEECYTSWKSHAAFGNCDGIIKNLDEQISNILKGE